MTLKKDVATLQDRLAQAGQVAAIQSLSLDDACVNLVLVKGGRRLRLSIFYLDRDAYPSGACLASTEGDDELDALLQGVNERHETTARLEDVLTDICAELGVECPVLRASISKQADDDEAEAMDDDEGSGFGSDGDSDGGGYDMAEADDQELTTTILQKLTKWQAVEKKHTPQQPEEGEEGDDATKKEEAAAMTLEEKLAAKRQIFNPREAFTMLSKELMDILRGTTPWLEADAIDEDVYRWDVYITQCSPSSPLAQDLEALESRTGESRIRLQLTFKRDLHPFFPAAVQVISPRFKGPLAGALASHPLLQLSHWDPWKPVKELASHLKDFLEEFGRVDMDATLEAVRAGRDSAYSEMEACLMRMEALTAMRPACADRYSDMYSARSTVLDAARIEALKPSSKRAKTEDNMARRAWAAGVGYGCGVRGHSNEVWDSRASAAAQAAHDAELQGLASRLAELLPTSLAGEAASDATGSTASPVAGSSANAAAAALEGIRESCLMPVLMTQLGTATFTDMCDRAAFYQALLSVAQRLAEHPPAAALFLQNHSLSTGAGATARDGRSVLLELRRQADHFLRVFVPSSDAAASSTAAGPSSSFRTSGGKNAAALAEAAQHEERTSLGLARLIVDIAGCVPDEACGAGPARQTAAAPAPTPAAPARRQTRSRAGAAAAQAATAAAQPPAAAQPQLQQSDREGAYEAAMKKWQMDTVAGLDAGHLYHKEPGREGVAPRPRMVRIAKELASLTATLPLNYSSSVFVRVDEGNLALWRAMITGPADTPYACGAFVFDFYFPPSYPAVPPKVLLRTTGGGRVRFNPNLYNCGKVCLSLLGTWSGERGESWDANVSSVLQVLVSIQSLILVPDPYFNEPGFEANMHNEQGREQSRQYSADIMEQTMHYAIEEQIHKPPAEFQSAIRDHFRLQKDTVVATCEKWIAEVEPHEGGRARRMRGHLTKIRSLLAAL